MNSFYKHVITSFICLITIAAIAGNRQKFERLNYSKSYQDTTSFEYFISFFNIPKTTLPLHLANIYLPLSGKETSAYTKSKFILKTQKLIVLIYVLREGNNTYSFLSIFDETGKFLSSMNISTQCLKPHDYVDVIMKNDETIEFNYVIEVHSSYIVSESDVEKPDRIEEIIKKQTIQTKVYTVIPTGKLTPH